MHVCRGNFRSTWISSGGYEPVAETLLGKLDIDGYFLEYDTERAGGFEPLRFLPKGKKVVVLGLITSKSGTLEKKDDVKRRIDEATKFVAARPVLPLAAMRLRLDRGRQHPHRGGSSGRSSARSSRSRDEVWGQSASSGRPRSGARSFRKRRNRPRPRRRVRWPSA